MTKKQQKERKWVSGALIIWTKGLFRVMVVKKEKVLGVGDAEEGMILKKS